MQSGIKSVKAKNFDFRPSSGYLQTFLKAECGSLTFVCFGSCNFKESLCSKFLEDKVGSSSFVLWWKWKTFRFLGNFLEFVKPVYSCRGDLNLAEV